MKTNLRCAFLFLISTIYCSAQDLKRQMISAQGASVTTATGLIVTQTVGQQSVTGSATGNNIVQQGYQQSFWKSLVAQNTNTIGRIKLYPTPVTDILHLEFSNITNLPLNVKIYDLNGRLVYSQNLQIKNSNLIIDVNELNAAMYLIILKGTNLNYHSKLLVN